eukprot:tig00021537_g22305.t1
MIRELADVFPVWLPTSAAAAARFPPSRRRSGGARAPAGPLGSEVLHPLIAGAPLPDSGIEALYVEEDSASAALGHVAHALRAAANYLAVPLRYPLLPRSSRSLVVDECPPSGPRSPSPAGPSQLPLYWGGAAYPPSERFELAVFYLCKDAQQVLRGAGLRAPHAHALLRNLDALYAAAEAEDEPGDPRAPPPAPEPPPP